MIGIICSDERMLHVFYVLAKQFDCIAINRDYNFKQDIHFKAIIFPVKGSYDQSKKSYICQNIAIPFDFLSGLDDNCMLFSGLYNSFLSSLNRYVVFYMEDEKVLEQNAILTAEGVLNIVIGALNKSIYDIQIDIIGFGHCGQALAKMFTSLNCNIRIISRVCSLQPNCICIDDYYGEIGDIIINTSEQKIFTQERIQGLINKPYIIDIATPEVIDLNCASENGICVEKCPNIPTRFCCISAGNVIANFIKGELENATV